MGGRRGGCTRPSQVAIPGELCGGGCWRGGPDLRVSGGFPRGQTASRRRRGRSWGRRSAIVRQRGRRAAGLERDAGASAGGQWLWNVDGCHSHRWDGDERRRMGRRSSGQPSAALVRRRGRLPFHPTRFAPSSFCARMSADRVLPRLPPITTTPPHMETPIALPRRCHPPPAVMDRPVHRLSVPHRGRDAQLYRVCSGNSPSADSTHHTLIPNVPLAFFSPRRAQRAPHPPMQLPPCGSFLPACSSANLKVPRPRSPCSPAQWLPAIQML